MSVKVAIDNELSLSIEFVIRRGIESVEQNSEMNIRDFIVNNTLKSFYKESDHIDQSEMIRQICELNTKGIYINFQPGTTSTKFWTDFYALHRTIIEEYCHSRIDDMLSEVIKNESEAYNERRKALSALLDKKDRDGSI